MAENVLDNLFFRIDFTDGSQAEIDGRRVLVYSPRNGSDLTLNSSGTGCNYDYLANSLSRNQAIVLVKTAGNSDIEKIVNTANIRTITPVPIKEEELYAERDLKNCPSYREI